MHESASVRDRVTRRLNLSAWRPPARGSYAAGLTLCWALLLATEVAISVWLCQGHLVYSLDDPYIHLTLANNILDGTYGINIGEASSPSSSIIWPWILAGSQWLRLGTLAPLLLDSVAAGAAVYTGARFLEEIGFVDPKQAPLFAATNGVVLILTTNALGLPMTGMEHSWHVLAVVLTVRGLFHAVGGRAPSFLVLAAIALTPLIRFEGAALASAAIMALFWLGYRLQAIAVAAIVALSIGAYAAYMSYLQLPLLPSSVLIKSQVTAIAYQGGASGFAAVIGSTYHNLIDNLSYPSLILSLAVCLLATYRQGLRSRWPAFYLPAAFTTVAHLCFGRHGGFYRYEIYVLTLGWLVTVTGLTQLRDWLAPSSARFYQATLLAIGAVFASSEVQAPIKTPLAARDVYDQQYQMARFAQQYYAAPVAVNDLGLVSFRNTNYVLDLFGLGSETVRKLRLSGRFDAKAINDTVVRTHVGLIMIYESWYPGLIPADWRRVAVLSTGPAVSNADSSVTFFASPLGDAGAIKAELSRFKRSLPPRDSLRILP